MAMNLKTIPLYCDAPLHCGATPLPHDALRCHEKFIASRAT